MYEDHNVSRLLVEIPMDLNGRDFPDGLVKAGDRLVKVLRAVTRLIVLPIKALVALQEAVLTWPRLYIGIHPLGCTEKKLRQSEALLRMAGRMVRFGGWAVDMPARRIDWSDEVCVIHEMPPGTSPALHEGINFYAPEYRDTIRAAFRACADEGTPYDLELQIITAKGRRVWVRAVGEAVRDASGEIIRVEGAFQDLSRRKTAQEALRQSEERFRLLSKATNDAIWDWDLTTNRIWWGDGFHLLFGIGQEEMDNIEAWMTRVHPDDRAWVLPSLEAAIGGEASSWSAEYRFRRNDGSYTVAHDRGYIVRDRNGRAVRMIGGMSDISERLQAEEALRESNRRITEILESITDGFFALDRQWRFVYLNPRAAELLQRRREDLLGKHVWTEFPEALNTAFYVQYQHAMRDKVAVSFEEVYPTTGIWVQATAYPSAKGLSVYLTDITQRKHAEEAVQRYAMRQGSLAEFGRRALASNDIEELLHQAAEVVCESLGVEFANVLQLAADGYSRVIRMGKGWDDAQAGHRLWAAGASQRNCSGLASTEPVIVHDFGRDPHASPSEVLVAHGIVSALEVPIGGGDNRFGWLGAYAREPGCFNDEDAVFLQSLAHTVQAALERRKAEARAAQLVQFDALTGLPNRHLFLDRLNQLLMQLRPSARQGAVLLLDLDRFSTVNDAFDHATGDELLRQVAERLQACLRPGDTLARVGGDEFGIVLAHLPRTEDAWLVAQKLLSEVKRPFATAGRQTYLTSSLGITLFPEDGEDAEALLKNANIAMYRAKEQGGNHYQYYVAAMHQRASERLRLEMHLRAALERGELDRQFMLHYQPRISASTGAWTGLEALIRWNHPEDGLIAPGRFVPLLEETGLIVEVGRWVVQRALTDYRCWQESGLTPPSVAVNVSLLQLRDARFVESVRALLDQAGVEGVPLEIEITESVIMQNIDDIVSKLRALKALGLAISIDDFGTGYSSLAYLATLPLDALKIDRAFISNLNQGKDNQMIVSTIISLAHSLKLVVVAEGVEEEKQAMRLKALKCDEMQGFLFSRPVPAGEVPALLQEMPRRGAK